MYGRQYYHSNGEIRGFRDHTLRPLPLKSVLEEKYGWGEEQAEQFCSWLVPMLKLRPEDRVTAAASAEHSFLTGVQVLEELVGFGKKKRQREVDEEKGTEKNAKKHKENKTKDPKTKKFKEQKSKSKKLELKLLAKKVASLQEQLSQQKIMIKKLEVENEEHARKNHHVERKLKEFQELFIKLESTMDLSSRQIVTLEIMKEQLEHMKEIMKGKYRERNILTLENVNFLKNIKDVPEDFERSAIHERQDMLERREEVTGMEINHNSDLPDPEVKSYTNHHMKTYNDEKRSSHQKYKQKAITGEAKGEI